jgi:hypothetical protein
MSLDHAGCTFLSEASPNLRVDAQRLYTADRSKCDECTVIRNCSVVKQPRQKSQRMIGQRRIDERLLPI